MKTKASSREDREGIEARHRDEIVWLKKKVNRDRSLVVKVSRRSDRLRAETGVAP